MANKLSKEEIEKLKKIESEALETLGAISDASTKALDTISMTSSKIFDELSKSMSALSNVIANQYAKPLSDANGKQKEFNKSVEDGASAQDDLNKSFKRSTAANFRFTQQVNLSNNKFLEYLVNLSQLPDVIAGAFGDLKERFFQIQEQFTKIFTMFMTEEDKKKVKGLFGSVGRFIQKDIVNFGGKVFNRLKDTSFRIISDISDGVKEIGEILFKELIKNDFVKKILDKFSIIGKFAQTKIGEPIKKAFNGVRNFSRSVVNDISTGFKELGKGISETVFGKEMTAKILKGIGQIRKSIGALGKLAAGVTFAGIIVILSAVFLLAKKIFDIFKQADEAVVEFSKSTGIFDRNMLYVLTEATKQNELLGGNIKASADAASAFVKETSVGVSLTSTLISNITKLGTTFGVSAENASKLVNILSISTGKTFEESSNMASEMLESFGKIGTAVTRNIVESYEDVNNAFAITYRELKRQGYLATQLGVTLSDLAKRSEGLLDFESSITKEFEASLLLGRQLNLSRARYLAFSGDLVGAQNEILDQVERLGGLERLNYFQRKALADATGMTVTQLQEELRLRRQIDQGLIDPRTQKVAMTKIDEILTRFKGAIFEIFADENSFKKIDELITRITDYLASDKFASLVDGLTELVKNLAAVLTGEKKLSLFRGFFGGSYFKDATPQDTDPYAIYESGMYSPGGGSALKPPTRNHFVLTPKGEFVSTNPRDYIMGMTNPKASSSESYGGNSDTSELKKIMTEIHTTMRNTETLLANLNRDGVKSVVNLDGRRVSQQLANIG